MGALLRRDNKVLLIHRFRDNMEYWVLPGGGVEDEETLEEALRREVMEETSLDVLNFELIRECPGYEGRCHYFYEVEINSKEAKLGGPEKADMNPNNIYILEWVDNEVARKLKDLFPEEIREHI